MSDKKISQLPASTTPLAGTELLPVVQSGVTKQVSVANLTAGRSVAAQDLTASSFIKVMSIDNPRVRIEHTGEGMGAGAVLGTLEFFGNDASVPGAGVKAAIEAKTVASLGDDAELVFYYSDGVTNKILGMRLTIAGNLAFPAGKGIDFSATTDAGGMTSELLGDYEEGTWTPVIFGSTTAGVGTYAAGGQQGVYTKIGNIVTVSCWLSWTAHTGTGDMAISGLPFGASISVNLMPGSVYASGFNAGTLATALFAYPTTSPANLALRGFVNAGTRTIPQVQASGQLAITATYRVA